MEAKNILSIERNEQRVSLWHARHEQLAVVLSRREDDTVCDLLCADPPYSEATHRGHDAGVQAAGDVKGYSKGNRGRDRERRYARRKLEGGKVRRRAINYTFWSPDDVFAFIETWSPLTRGWMVCMCDHTLIPVYEDAYRHVGRYPFAPIPFVWPGSGVRHSGDGPPNWTRYVMVARPRTMEFARWGVPEGGGAYLMPPGHSERPEVVGGKPLWLLEAIVRDYSDAGDVVCDPCCGAGTTLVAAVRAGRTALGGDALIEHANIAKRNLESSRARMMPLVPDRKRRRAAAVSTQEEMGWPEGYNLHPDDPELELGRKD